MSLPEVPGLSVLDGASEAIYSIAVVINGTVYQVISTDGQSAAQFLAQPTFVQVDRNEVQPGMSYNAETNTFTN